MVEPSGSEALALARPVARLNRVPARRVAWKPLRACLQSAYIERTRVSVSKTTSGGTGGWPSS